MPYLGRDAVNPDGVNWHFRSQQFIVALKSGQFANAYQHYHPGVTLMWVTGVPIEIYKQVTGIHHYDVENFMHFHFVAKISLVLFQLVLSILLIHVLSQIVDLKKAFFIVSLLSFESFFIGNSRLYHMDVLFTLFVFLSLVTAYLSLSRDSRKYALIAGAFIALSFLTKSIGVGIFLYILILSSMHSLYHKKKIQIHCLAIYAGSFLLVTFLLFPALWVKPAYVVGEIFREGERVGIRKGHEQIVLGDYSEDGGILFYPLVLLTKLSPLSLLAGFGSTVFIIRNIKRNTKTMLKNVNKLGKTELGFIMYMLFFYLVYLIVMCYPAKKIDRYILVTFPMFAYLAVYFFENILLIIGKSYGNITKGIISGLIAYFIVLPAIGFYPYYFTYVSPLLGTPAYIHENILAQKPFGIGIPDLKDAIISRYGNDVTVGFLDTKPMKAIYSNSKVVDIRDYGPSNYDILILGVNENMNEKILDSDIRFIKDFSIFINDLEYWRIYVKENV